MAEHNELGKEGELEAARYLETKGYVIKASNWRFGRYELDLVVEKGELVVFVEVKSRSSQQWGSGADAVTRSKARMIIDAAGHYVRMKNCDKEVRFDVLSLHKENGEFVVDHIEEAFRPQMR